MLGCCEEIMEVEDVLSTLKKLIVLLRLKHLDGEWRVTNEVEKEQRQRDGRDWDGSPSGRDFVTCSEAPVKGLSLIVHH